MENIIKDFEQLAMLAYKGEELSDFAPLHTKYMYLRLSILYDCFSRGKYSKNQCVIMKNQLRNEYVRILKQHTTDMECYREYMKNRMENQMLLIELEKSISAKAMLEPALKIVGNCVGDKNLYLRNMKKCES